MNFYALLPLFAFVVNVSAGVLIAAQAHHRELRRQYIYFAVSLSLWPLTEFFFWSPLPEKWLDALFILNTFGYMPVCYLMLRFVYIICNRAADLWLRLSELLLLVHMVLGITTRLIFTGYEPEYWGNFQIPGPLYEIMVCSVIVYPVCLSLYLLAMEWKKADTMRERKQYSLIFIGVFASATFGVIANILIPAALQLKNPIQLAAWGTIFISLCMCVAVYKYRFLAVSVDDMAQELFEGSRDGVILLDSKGRAIQVNSASKSLFSLAGKDWLGKTLPELMGQELEWSAEGTAELTFCQDISAYHLLLTRVARISGNTLLGHVIIIRDVTAETEAREVLRTANDVLENRVRERTEELEKVNANLLEEMEQRKRAEEALIVSERLAAVGTLAGGIAHEFNNMNAIVLGYTQLLLGDDEITKTEYSAWIESIHNASKRMKNVTRNMLSFAGKQEQNILPSSLNLIIKEVVNLTSHEVQREGVVVETELGDIPNSMMDPGQITQVLLNLFINAIHAMKDRPEKRLRVVSELDGDKIRVRINDTGWGISRENLSKIFTPFFSTKGEHAAPKTADRKVKGTGLGLSVCRTIMDKHKGSLLVESTERVGTTFTLELPILEVRKEEVFTNQPENASAQPQLKGKRALVVEDEEMMQKMLTSILGVLGFDCVTSDDGMEALESVRETVPDIIFLDMKMPKMDGSEFLRHLRKEPLPFQPPVIIVTGWDNEEGESISEELDVSAILYKPFLISEISATVMKVFSRAQPSA
ncbi:MAG: response regulator [Planctomycetes bacterium]|nr:response regulator [Planctomycetota bacterium]